MTTLPEMMTVYEVMKLMDKALKLEGAEQRELVEALLATGPHAKENIGYLTGYFIGEKATRLLKLFDTEHPVFGRSNPTPEEAFALGAKMGEELKKNRER